jgi:hypothetical protein
MIKWSAAIKTYRHWEELGEYIKADAIRSLMIHALSKRERQVYEHIKANHGIATPQIGAALHMSNQHAWDVCQLLLDRYLVWCKSVKTDTGEVLVWRVR